MAPDPPAQPRTASYEADPAEVRRVLLLYSGGLDTSVMLKWIQDSYGAEVVCLTVNLGQPGEDYDVVRGKALQLGALDCHVVDAREEFAREYVLPAIQANADYGDGYPLFTALGRPLIAKLAVEYARKTGCDTIAHGCTGKGNDQVRIEATVATLAPELRTIAPVRSWQMGRDEEIAYAREHGIPVKGGTEEAPYSIDDNLWGRSSEGRWIEDLGRAPEDDVFQLVTRPELAPDEAEVVEVEFEAGVPVGLNGERLGLVDLFERVAEIGCRHGVGIVDHIEDRIVGLKVRDIYEAPAAAILLTAHQELENRPRRLYGRRQRAGDRQDRAEALQGQRAGDHPHLSERRLRRGPGVVRGVGRALFTVGLSRLHRDLLAAIEDGAPDPPARGGVGMTRDKLGKAAIRFAFKYVRRRYRREIRIGTGVAVAALAVAAYLASRNVPEG